LINIIVKLWQSIKLSFLAFFLAVLTGGLLIAFSDPNVLSLWKSPFRFFSEAINVSAKAYAALFQGAIFDVNLTKRSFVNGFYPLSETFTIAAPEIIERKPAALWQRDGKYSLIDANGIVLANVRAGVGGELPTLNGRQANAHIVALNALLDKASALKSHVSGATWIGNRRWDLQFQTGETLALPEGEAEAAKALLNFARLDGVHRLLGRDLIHFDLRDPDRAYFRKAPKAKPVKADNNENNENNEITSKNNGRTA